MIRCLGNDLIGPPHLNPSGTESLQEVLHEGNLSSHHNMMLVNGDHPHMMENVKQKQS